MSAKSSYEVCQLLFLIVIVVYLITEMIKFFRYKSYLFQIWNWLELVHLVVSVVAVMLSLFKAKETSLDVRRIQSNPYKGSSSAHHCTPPGHRNRVIINSNFLKNS